MMNNKWNNEGCELVSEPKSGTRTIRFPFGNNIYYETPCASPDGSRFLVRVNKGERFSDCVCDIATMSYAIADEGGKDFNCAYDEFAYFTHKPEKPGSPYRIYRTSLITMKRELFVEVEGLPDFGVSGGFVSPSPKGDYLICFKKGPEGSRIFRVNTADGSWKTIFEDPENLRHIVVEPSEGNEIIVQENRGAKVDEQGREVLLVGEEGAYHFLIRPDGTERYQLPVGEPHTYKVGGHICWIGSTKRVITNVVWHLNEFGEPGKPIDWSTDKRYPETTFFTVGRGDKKPTPFSTPGQRCWHISASRCGKYFVASSVPTRMGPTDIVIGNFVTGKWRVFVHDCHCYTGSCWPSSQPFFSGDGKHVIYREKDDPNIPKYGGLAVYAAEVTDELYGSLE